MITKILKKISNIFNFRSAYDALQNLLGAYNFMNFVVSKYVNPFLSENDVIVDVGAGSSKLYEFIRENITYISIEPNENYTQYAAKKFGAANFKILNGGYEALKELRDYNLVIIFGVIHHMDDKNAKRMLDYAVKNLKKNGRVIVCDPCRHQKQGFLSKLLMDSDRGNYIRNFEQYNQIFESTSMDFTSDKYINPKELLLPYKNLVTTIFKN